MTLDFAHRAGSLGHLSVFGILLGVSAVCFHLQQPEKSHPYRFDYFGTSHQMMHVLTVAALLVQYFGVVEAFQFWHKHNGECSVAVNDMLRAVSAQTAAQ
ncbi:hypothetical protein HDU82_002544 [Entophlyctis luteolus]|nr:hypothetical protein HDU82_002544 [Entophlyctis luteolus]